MTEFTALNKDNEYITCEIVVEFDYNNKKYVLYTDDEKNIHAAYLDNNELKQIINDEEFDLINNIYKQIIYKPLKADFINYAPIIYNGIRYKSVFDLNDNNRYFYEYKNDKYVPVNDEIKECLDNIYNKSIEIMYSGHEVSDSKNFKDKIIKKTIKLGNLTIVALIVANFAMANVKAVDLDKSFLQNISSITEMYKVDERNHDVIMSYINNNTKLSKNDKDFIMSMDHFFKENEEYFDMSNLKKNLLNLKIIYDKDNQIKYKVSDRTKGYYVNILGQIIIFYSDKLDDDIITKKVVFHEIMHAISNNGYVSKGRLGLALTEGINELMTEEYLGTYSDIYNKNQTYARIMCELIGPEKIKESFFQNDVDMILEELSNICGNKKDAQKFISLIDDEAKCDTTILINEKRQDVIDALKMKKELSPEIDKYLKIYYEKKFNRHIEDDKLMQAYMDSLRLTNNLESEFYNPIELDKINVVKNYFNSDLVKNDQQVTVEYIYKNNIKKNINKYDIEITKDGKYRRTFKNGKHIDYDVDPNLLTYKNAIYSFNDAERYTEDIKTF